MRHPIPTLVLLASLLLSGCADPGQRSPDAAAAQPEEHAHALDAAPASNATVDADGNATWFVADLNAAVTGLRWSVPEGSVQTYHVSESFSWDAVVLRGTLLADAATAYGVFVYDLNDGARLVASTVAAGGTFESYAVTPAPLEGSFEPSVQPFTVYLPSDLEGEEVGIVVATAGMQGTPRFAWTSMDHFPAPLEEEPEDTEAFLEQQTGAPAVVPAVGHGDRFLASRHYEAYFGALYTPGVFGVRHTVGDVTVEDRLPTWVPPYGGARDVTVTARHDLEGGWSSAYVLHWLSAGAGSYDVRMDVHGATVETSGVQAEAPFAYNGLVALLTGRPLGYVEGDGTGGAEAALDLQVVTDNDFTLSLVGMESFDASLETLLGEPSVDAAYGYGGLLLASPEGVARVDAGGGFHVRL